MVDAKITPWEKTDLFEAHRHGNQWSRLTNPAK